MNYLAGIGIGYGTYDSRPITGSANERNPIVIGDGAAGHVLAIEDGASFTGISLQRGIGVNVLAISSIVGINVNPTINTSQNITGITGFNFQPAVFGSAGTITQMAGVLTSPNASIGATVTTLIALKATLMCQVATVGTAIGIDVVSNDLITDPTTTIGLRIGVGAVLKGATIWGMQVGNYQSYHQGPVIIGAAAAPVASSVLDLSSTTGALVVPRMTTTQKNALTPLNGMVVYDSTLNKIQCYQGGAWTSLA